MPHSAITYQTFLEPNAHYLVFIVPPCVVPNYASTVTIVSLVTCLLVISCNCARGTRLFLWLGDASATGGLLNHRTRQAGPEKGTHLKQ